MSPRPSRGRRLLRGLALVFALLWAASQTTRCVAPVERRPEVDGDEQAVVVAAPRATDARRIARDPRADDVPRRADADDLERTDAGEALLTYRRYGEVGRPVVLMLHGSPGGNENFRFLAPRLGERHDVVVPDMLGFGSSTLDVPDHGCRAQAAAMLDLLDALDVDVAHVVGYSLGGGVAIEMTDLAPRRVASITLFSSIGVQELELLGDHHLNHALHALQHGAVWLALNVVPHFGAWDGRALGYGYTLSFHDTDQRPLRAALRRYAGPMLVLHGEHDPLVPPEAALEHHRIVPQSELVMMDASHFLPFRDDHDVHATIGDFVTRVEAGEAIVRATADPARVATAAVPYDPASAPAAEGFFLVVIMLLLVVSTFVSEDLTCLAAGVMVGAGRLPFLHATAACFVGIFVGDVALYFAGRWLGRPAVERAPLRWVLTPGSVASAERFFATRGTTAVFVSRFVPGFRLPTYFAAGVARQSLLRFAVAFAIACALWTPILVGIAALVGNEARAWFESFGAAAPLVVIGALVAVWVAIRWLVPLTTQRGRRLVRGRWLRLRHWEFWPAWTLYAPVLLAVAGAALRHRGLRVVTAANPSMPTGGLVGESKSAILDGLAGAGDAIARHGVIDAALDGEARVARLDALVDELRLGWPLVVKPDRGERGEGVVIARDRAAALAAVRDADDDLIVQEYVPGREFGVFYARRPDEPVGRILSVVDKLLPSVVGDGRRTVEQLIFDDERAVALASSYLEQLGDEAARTPAAGERVTIAHLGTHCRGAIFRDGSDLATDALRDALDAIARADPGFFFGRFDLRVPDEDALRAGRDIKVLELNGLTSESAHVYDRRHPITYAWRVLSAQWRLAFEIGAANVARGAAPSSWREVRREVARFLGR